jgi:hypothetical protein
MSNNDPIKIISEFLKDLGYKNSNIDAIAHKMVEEILDNVLLELLEKEEQEELIEALGNEDNQTTAIILSKINRDDFKQKFIFYTDLSFKEILDKLISKLSPEEVEIYSNQLEELENKYKVKSQFIDKSPDSILEMLSK